MPGARFCTQCGAAAGAGARARASSGGGSSPNLPWYLAGGVLLLLIIILLVPMMSDGDDITPGPFAAPNAAGSGTPPPLTGTPREQADRLFNRIMSARDQGDTAEALRFTPMAIQAYDMAAPLDNDGLFHLATVHIVASDADAARQSAERILSNEPDHLLGLAVAAEAADLAGDSAAALNYHRRFLAAFDAEVARGLQEYQDHSRILPEYRTAAMRAVDR